MARGRNGVAHVGGGWLTAYVDRYWLRVSAIVLYCLVLSLYLLAQVGGHTVVTGIDDLALGLGPLLSVSFGLTLRHRQRARGIQALTWAPRLLALSLVSWAIGEAIWAYDTLVLHREPGFPSWANLSYVCAYGLLLAGILALPRRRLPRITRTRIVLDGLMIVMAMGTFSWYFIVGPILLLSHQPASIKVGGVFYVLSYFVLFTCVLLLLASRAAGAIGPRVAYTLALGLTAIVAADSIFNYLDLRHLYSSGGPLDALWALGYMLIGLGASLVALGGAEQPPTAPMSIAVGIPDIPSWQSLLPYALLPAIGALGLYSVDQRTNSILPQGVYVGAATLVGLVVLRQVVALRELHATYRDNAALSQANTMLETMATTDALTGLPNRTLYHRRLAEALAAGQITGQSIAVLLMDLDRFKEVNDTFGHHYGDLLLQQVGASLQRVLRGADTVARLGGDEFALLLPNTDAAGAVTVSAALLKALDVRFLLEGQAVDVDASIGIALFPDHGVEVDALLRQADVAMYTAKRAQSGHTIYDAAQDNHNPHRLALMGELRLALGAGALLLYYQPLVNLQSGALTGVEALLRWPRPDGSFIPPDQFIPLAEHTGLMMPLTDWVLNTALGQCRAWQDAGHAIGVQVNLSARTLQDMSLPERVDGLLRRYDVSPALLTLEITESALMADPVRAREVLIRLAAIGVRLAIDDFGTGYSSLAYLKNLPVDEVKIDKGFVLGMATAGADQAGGDQAIVHSVVTLAHALRLTVVAEGVETTGAWDTLRVLGCDTAQGYLLSRPLPAVDLEAWFTRAPAGGAERQRASA